MPSDETQSLKAADPIFPFTELLQHHAQTGRTGMFQVECPDGESFVYLMSGVVAHVQSPSLHSEVALWELLALKNPRYVWHDGRTPRQMTMSGSVQDLMLKGIQVQASGELDRLKSQQRMMVTTRNIEDSVMLYVMTLDVRSNEISPFQFIIRTRQARVGRAPENELTLNDTSVSRKHAVLILNQDAVLVRDLGSKNGITINGQAMTQGLLRDQDVLTIGEVICKLNVSKSEKIDQPAPAVTASRPHAA